MPAHAHWQLVWAQSARQIVHSTLGGGILQPASMTAPNIRRCATIPEGSCLVTLRQRNVRRCDTIPFFKCVRASARPSRPNRGPGLRKRAPSTALGLLGVSPPASQEGTSAILWRCILLVLRSERASSADEALILWTLDSCLALALAPTHLHGIECPPMPITCSNRAVPASPSEPPHTIAPELFLIFDGNRTGPGGRLETVHSVSAQRS